MGASKTYKLDRGAVARFLISKGFHRCGSPKRLGVQLRGNFAVGAQADGMSLRVEHATPWRSKYGGEPEARRAMCLEYTAALNERYAARFIDTEDGGFVLVTLRAEES